MPSSRTYRRSSSRLLPGAQRGKSPMASLRNMRRNSTASLDLKRNYAASTWSGGQRHDPDAPPPMAMSSSIGRIVVTDCSPLRHSAARSRSRAADRAAAALGDALARAASSSDDDDDECASASASASASHRLDLRGLSPQRSPRTATADTASVASFLTLPARPSPLAMSARSSGSGAGARAGAGAGAGSLRRRGSIASVLSAASSNDSVGSTTSSFAVRPVGSSVRTPAASRSLRRKVSSRSVAVSLMAASAPAIPRVEPGELPAVDHSQISLEERISALPPPSAADLAAYRLPPGPPSPTSPRIPRPPSVIAPDSPDSTQDSRSASPAPLDTMMMHAAAAAAATADGASYVSSLWSRASSEPTRDYTRSDLDMDLAIHRTGLAAVHDALSAELFRASHSRPQYPSLSAFAPHDPLTLRLRAATSPAAAPLAPDSIASFTVWSGHTGHTGHIP